MPLPAYSSTGLPYSPLVDTWQEVDAYLDPVETDMDGGNKRLRSKPGDDVQHITFDILYTKAQLTTLKTFIKTTLGLGTARFTMTVWTGATHELKTVQFAKKIKTTQNEPKVRVSYDLWVFN